MRTIRRNTLSWLLAPLLGLGACMPGGDADTGEGSGGGIGGSGLIVTSGRSEGPVTGFGSIVLNGRRFDTDDAELRILERSVAQSELEVGMVVSADVDFATDTASRVLYVPDLRGPIDRLDAAAGTLRVLGRGVRFDAATAFVGSAPAGLAVGGAVEISAIEGADGTLLATLVRPAPTDGRVLLSGVVDDVDELRRRLTLDGLPVGYGALGASVSPVEGARWYAIGQPGPGGAAGVVLEAEQLASIEAPELASGVRIELEGIVTDFRSTTSFDVGGRAVRLESVARIELGDGRAAPEGAIARDTRVEVEGRVGADDVISATRVIVVPAEDSRLEGQITALDATAGTLVVLGVRTHVTARTRVRTDTRGDGATVADLRIGDYVEVRAAFAGDVLVASRVEVDDADEDSRLEGPVTSVDAADGTLEVLGVPIVLGEDTDIELDGDEVDASSFFRALRTGDVVRARWRNFRAPPAAPDDVGRD